MKRPRQTRVHLKRLGYIACVECGVRYPAWYKATRETAATARLGQTVGLAPSDYPPRCERCERDFKDERQPRLDFFQGEP